MGERPLLTLPTSCGAPPQFGIEALGTWQEEFAVTHEDNPLFKAQSSVTMHNNADEPVGITGCEKLVHFQPTIEAAPDTSDTDSPAGLTATVRIPQGVNPEGLATAGLHATTVVLPEGMVDQPRPSDRPAGLPVLPGRSRAGRKRRSQRGVRRRVRRPRRSVRMKS